MSATYFFFFFKYLDACQTILIFVYPIKLSNHNLSCDKFILLFFLMHKDKYALESIEVLLNYLNHTKKTHHLKKEQGKYILATSHVNSFESTQPCMYEQSISYKSQPIIPNNSLDSRINSIVNLSPYYVTPKLYDFKFHFFYSHQHIHTYTYTHTKLTRGIQDGTKYI